nr:zinc finger, CCHC-type [Tanacetum cinerariifolium]
MAEEDAFLVTTLKVVYVLTTPMPELLEDATVEAIRIRAKWENDDYICRGHILNEESLRAQDSDKGKGKQVGGPSINMIEEGGKNKHHKQNKDKKRSNENNNGSGSNKKPKLKCWKCGKTGHFKRDCRSSKKNNAIAGGSGKGSKDQSQDNGQNLVHVWNRFVKFSVSLISEAFYVQVDAITWWIDSGATTHVCKDRCWFKTFEPVEDGVPNKRNKTTPYKLWNKKQPNLSFLRVWGYRAVVRLPNPKRKTLGEKGIDCVFVGYAEHSKAYRPKDIIPNSDESQRVDHSDDVPSEISKPHKDAAFWKEAIDDEIRSIMENNTWVLSDLPPGCKPLGCKWIFKKKMKVDGTIDKFKARLIIQGFRQKEGFDYFDTYALVVRITTIRLLLALDAIHNLVIHQMDVKTIFLNGGLDEEVYMKQPEGFVMLGNEHKLCAISWASKKQTCITGSTMESEFAALDDAGKEVEWLRNLIHEIPIWPKPIAPISIRCNDKDMTTNFGKLDKFEGHDFRRWQKKMHFLLTTLKVVYVLTTPMPELLEDATVEAIRIRSKWENNNYICRGHILNGMSDSLFDVYTNVESAKELWDSLESKYMDEDSSSKKFLDFKHTLKHGKDDLSLVQLGSHLRIEESLRVQDSDKGRGKEVGGPSVNMIEDGAFYVQVDAIAWWIDSSSTTHVCKDRCWFKTFAPVEDESVLYMGDEHFAPVHGKGSVSLEFSSEKTVTLFNVLYVLKLHKNLVFGHVLNKCGYKQVYESDKYISSKCGDFVGFGYYTNCMFMLNLNKVPDDFDSVYMSSSSTVVNTSLWHARLGHVHYKRMLKMSKDDLIHAIDENFDKCTTCMLTKITRQPFKSITRKSVILELIHSDLCDFHATPSLGVIHETIAPYTPQQNGVAKRKNRSLKEIIVPKSWIYYLRLPRSPVQDMA